MHTIRRTRRCGGRMRVPRDPGGAEVPKQGQLQGLKGLRGPTILPPRPQLALTTQVAKLDPGLQHGRPTRKSVCAGAGA